MCKFFEQVSAFFGGAGVGGHERKALRFEVIMKHLL